MKTKILVIFLILMSINFYMVTYADNNTPIDTAVKQTFDISDVKQFTGNIKIIEHYNAINCYVAIIKTNEHELKFIVPDKQYLNKQVKITYSTSNNYIFNQYDIICWEILD